MDIENNWHSKNFDFSQSVKTKSGTSEQTNGVSNKTAAKKEVSTKTQKEVQSKTQKQTQNDSQNRQTKLTSFFPIRRSERRPKQESEAIQQKLIDERLLADDDEELGLEIRQIPEKVSTNVSVVVGDF